MPQKLIDMTNERYGRLVVIGLSEKRNSQGKPMWKCRCDCGNITDVSRRCLINGSTKSCGCYRREFSREQHTTHGLSKSNDKHYRLYRIWSGVKDRCLNPKSKYWNKYGGRGITVCDEWANDYMTFHNWSISNGYADELTLDREDNNKGYSPDNCRWVTYEVQENNRSDNILYEVDGERYTLAQLSRKENSTRALTAKKHKEDLVNGK